MRMLALVLVVILAGHRASRRRFGAGASGPSISNGSPSDFGRAASGFGVRFVIVHLNDLTTDALFEAPLKYSLRAQARSATMFYVEGAANDDIELSTDFRIQQGAEEFRGADRRHRQLRSRRAVDGRGRDPGHPRQRGAVRSSRRPIHVYYGALRVTFDFSPGVLAQLAGD